MIRGAAAPRSSEVQDTYAIAAEDKACGKPEKARGRTQAAGEEHRPSVAARRLLRASSCTGNGKAGSKSTRRSAPCVPGGTSGAMAGVHGRLVDATETEIEVAVRTVVGVLGHPIMRRAASVAASDLRRETPIFLDREDGTLLEGVVDLAYREEAADLTEWTVVDFKTDREFELNRAEYTAQVAYYTQAIEKATSSSASGVLLVI